jgi:hypothetical protein
MVPEAELRWLQTAQFAVGAALLVQLGRLSPEQRLGLKFKSLS